MSTEGSGHNKNYSRGATSAEWECVRLCTLRHRGLGGRVKESVGIVGRILSLDQTVELRVLGGLLTENRVTESRRVCCEVL